MTTRNSWGNNAVHGVPPWKGSGGDDWFFNADESACVLRETVESSDAVLIHLGRVGDILGPVVQLGGGIQIEMFGGSPSAQLVQALEAFSPTYYTSFQGK